MEETTIVVVDDHPLVRQGVANTVSLEPGFQVVGQIADGVEASSLIRPFRPQVAVVEINLPGMRGQQFTHLHTVVVEDRTQTFVFAVTRGWVKLND